MPTSSATGITGTIGSRPSRQNETYVEYEPRIVYAYQCPKQHVIPVTLHFQADPPPTWTCPTCSAPATLDGKPADTAPNGNEQRTKTHMDQLKERRSEEELEALLEEALHNYRTTGKAF